MSNDLICDNCGGEIDTQKSRIRIEDPVKNRKVDICSVDCLTEWLVKHPNKLQTESINKHAPKT